MAIVLKFEPAQTQTPLAFLRRYLEMIDGLRGPGRLCAERLVLAYGLAGTPARLPKGLRKGRYKHCFTNTTRRILSTWDAAGWPEGDVALPYTYCEGWAIHAATTRVPVSGLVAHHAWLVAPDGTIYDPTWHYSPEHVYLGVPIKWPWLRRSIVRTQRMGGIFGDRQLYTDPPAEWLATLEERTP